MIELRKFLAPEFIFGNGALTRCPDYVRTFGASKVLVVSDRGVVRAGWTGRVEALLKDSGIAFERYDAVSPNPRDGEVSAGVEFYLHNRCDMIVAVGGGSPIDCAKGIGVVAANGGDVLDYEGVDKVPIPMPPLLCIPTTAGTSADVSQFAIILDSAGSNKIAIISKGVVPDISLIDPDTTVTMDAELTAATGLDALTHAIEAYASNASSPITDMHAFEAIGYLVAYLERAVEKPGDVEARSGTMMGSLLAGLAFSNASLGLVHAMAHPLGGLLDLPHGLCNALLLEHVVAFNFDAAPDRYRKILGVLAGGTPRGEATVSNSADISASLVGALSGLRRRLGLGGRLSREPVPASVIAQLVERALLDPCLATNPKQATRADIAGIYETLLK